MRHPFLVTILAALLGTPAAAQTADAPVVQFYSYDRTDKTAFEEGYRRHLEWHVRAGDKLSWFAWEVNSGERLGLFIDGTVASLPALDTRPDLAGDGADFARTAAAYAKPVSIETWSHWPIRGTIPFPLAPAAGNQADVFRIQVAPARLKAFEAAVAELRIGTPGGLPVTWLKLARGGPAPSYLLFVQRRNWSDIDRVGHTFPDVLRAAFGADQKTADAILAEIESVHVESWRYLPRLSLTAGQPLAK